MFELSVACKYLIPRWRQLSVSIISLISILVIALVVWLIVVFFSVTHGLEKSWIQKLIALTAPVRITPTQEYYNSYYYLVDGISSKSGYSLKTISEKKSSLTSDPYDPNADEEPPSYWQQPLRDNDGKLKDLVSPVFQAINNLKGIPGLTAQDFEMAGGNLRLQLVRGSQQSFVSQASYLGSIDPKNSSLPYALLPLSMADLNNALQVISAPTYEINENFFDHHLESLKGGKGSISEKLHSFFEAITVNELKTPDNGWILPRYLLPDSAVLQVAVVSGRGKIWQVIIPQDSSALNDLKQRLSESGADVQLAKMIVDKGIIHLDIEGNKTPYVLSKEPLVLEADFLIKSSLVKSSLNGALRSADVIFNVQAKLQGIDLKGHIPLGDLQIAQTSIKDHFLTDSKTFPFWLHTVVNSDGSNQMVLPIDPQLGEGVLLPRSFREAGALIGDRGYISYYTSTAAAVQEQKLPVIVAGFYDPGIMPIGGKLIFVNQEMTTLVRAAQGQEETALSNGINVRFQDISQAEQVQAAIEEALEKEGIAQYWHVETFREFDFTKDLIQQLRSEKNLWTLIAAVIIIVACSNIISMLIILVNDKKLEIGILRSMGASSANIAIIFGFCGVVMGIAGSLIGTVVAIITLKNLQVLIDFISRLQGHQMFNPLFYGNTLPSEISFEALTFVVVATAIASLIAGIVPAVKASRLRPAAILRSE